MTSVRHFLGALGLAAIICAGAGDPRSGSAAVPPPVVSYAAPAGALPAGHLNGLTYNAVLPSGRLVTPSGTSVVVGMNALGLALTPDGRFAIVSNDDRRGGAIRSVVDPQTAGGYSLAVVDTATMTVVDRFRALGERYFVGLAALDDPRSPGRTLVLAAGGGSNRVYAFDLDLQGRLTPDAVHAIAIAAPPDRTAANALSFPATIATAKDGRHAYVVGELADAVSTIDLMTRTQVGAARAVGYRPIGMAVAGSRLLVTNEGLMRYGTMAAPTSAPPFRLTPDDIQRASSLTVLALGADGTLSGEAADSPFVPMDRTPDGVANVGGAHPSALAVTPDGNYAFVAMANVDRIATVELGVGARVIGGVELRLFERGPYGTQPSALALSRDGSRLYVALTGLNAIAVIDAHDPAHLHRLGLIPTGWAPSALALSADDRVLFVANARGFGADNGYTGDGSADGDASAVWATLQRIDLGAVVLGETTRATLAATRRVVAKAPAYPAAVRNVVLVLEDGRTFDAALGDLGYGPADPAFVESGDAVTPNLHALARRFALAGNYFVDAEEPAAGHQFATAGTATVYTQRHVLVGDGRGAFATNEDPEDYPRAGYVYNAVARHGLSFRDYGELLRVAGYQPADPDAPAAPMGGIYTLDAPAPAVLAGHVDLRYPGWNLRVTDARRADEFVRDYGSQVAAGTVPRLATVRLSNRDPADGDRALGTIVAYLSHTPAWRTTVIVVAPVAAVGGRDHIDEHRSFALIVSPYAKRRYIGARHLSTASVLKTVDGILRLGPLSLGDLLATDMSDFFTRAADVRPYEAPAVSGRS